MASIMVSWYTCNNLVTKCYPQKFCGVCSICESNIFMLKSQKLDEGFLSYIMSEVFNKTGYTFRHYNCLR